MIISKKAVLTIFAVFIQRKMYTPFRMNNLKQVVFSLSLYKTSVSKEQNMFKKFFYLLLSNSRTMRYIVLDI